MSEKAKMPSNAWDAMRIAREELADIGPTTMLWEAEKQIDLAIQYLIAAKVLITASRPGTRETEGGPA